jgi:pyruvate carboxylase subunit A
MNYQILLEKYLRNAIIYVWHKIKRIKRCNYMFKKVLVANRGEIAMRVIRALRELGISPVTIYSDVDSDSLHTLQADVAYPLNGDHVLETYANIDKIIKIAQAAGVEAIHPGYGLLSEKEEFAKAVENAGIKFIGPSSSVIGLMGNKIAARKMMKELKVPITPGTEEAISNLETAKKIAKEIGYPVLIKAAAGGGGMGMKVVRTPDEMEELLAIVEHQAASVFGDKSVFIEKYIEHARHIEIQILADSQGNVVHLGERECSIQRRHQKIIEESPSTALNEKTRIKMGEAAVKIAKAVKYQGAGTIEFIYSNGEFYFLEMNTRIQVEHPVTEMLTGIDIVKTQVKIAAGEPLPFKQEDIKFRGHVIECRICAEDPLSGFKPSPSKIVAYHVPGGVGVRVDSGVHLNYEISMYYDSMISKLLVWGENREEAILRMQRALQEYIILGPKTNIPYLTAIMENLAFQKGDISTKFVEDHPYLFDTARILEAKYNYKNANLLSHITAHY